MDFDPGAALTGGLPSGPDPDEVIRGMRLAIVRLRIQLTDAVNRQLAANLAVSHRQKRPASLPQAG